MMCWILWQQIIKWVLKKLRTKLKPYDLILQRSTKHWQKKKWCRCRWRVCLSLVCVQITNVHFGIHNTKRLALDKQRKEKQRKVEWLLTHKWRQVEACVHDMRQKACPWWMQCGNVKVQEEDESARVWKWQIKDMFPITRQSATSNHDKLCLYDISHRIYQHDFTKFN